MTPSDDPTAHRPGIVIELHLEESRAHARYLPAALLGARSEAGRPERQPAEQTKPRHAERNRCEELPARGEKGGAAERHRPARELQSLCQALDVGLGEQLEHPP